MNKTVESYQALSELYLQTEINTNAKDFNEILGFICCIAASPQPLELADWFPHLWKKGSPSFSHEAIANNFAAAILQFYEGCLNQYQQAAPLLLPTVLWLNESGRVTEQGSAFASGYLTGFNRTETIWQNTNLAMGSEPEQLLQTSLLLLSKMAMPDNADPQMQKLFVELPDMAEIISSLPALIGALGNFSVQVKHYD